MLLEKLLKSSQCYVKVISFEQSSEHIQHFVSDTAIADVYSEAWNYT